MPYLLASKPRGSNAMSVRIVWIEGKCGLRNVRENIVARAWGLEAHKYGVADMGSRVGTQPIYSGSNNRSRRYVARAALRSPLSSSC